jgi:CTP synthase
MRSDVGRDNTLYIHVTWLPYIGATRELRPNPRSIPCVSFVRSASPRRHRRRLDYPIGDDLAEKIASSATSNRAP